jgi:hypothetical protein
MSIARKITVGTAVAATTALGLGLAVAPATAKQGTAPLASVLVDDNKFDNNGKDYDIVTEAVLAVLGAKPDSPVGLLTKGKARLTAFAPQDRAFLRLVDGLTGTRPASEEAAFTTIASALPIEKIEEVLLLHVVAGKTITGKQAVKARGAKLKTAQGEKLTIRVQRGKIRVVDQNREFPNPRVVQANINKGNRQIAHGINAVLIPKAGLLG